MSSIPELLKELILTGPLSTETSPHPCPRWLLGILIIAISLQLRPELQTYENLLIISHEVEERFGGVRRVDSIETVLSQGFASFATGILRRRFGISPQTDAESEYGSEGWVKRTKLGRCQDIIGLYLTSHSL